MKKKIYLTCWALFFATSLFAQGLDLNLLKDMNGPVSGVDKPGDLLPKKLFMLMPLYQLVCW
ncbi:hypothetical protein [Mucilaginibacter sp. NFX135]|uniref:hypothetical protein n=1 Tax=Mucilaginibacter sp. NFX135 TaxID=3402687 RepID=UPI003AFA6412